MKIIFYLKCLIFLLFAAMPCFDLFAQSNDIDSLQILVKSNRYSSLKYIDKVNTLTILSNQLSGVGEYDKSMKFAKDALVLVNTLLLKGDKELKPKLSKAVVNSYITIGNVYYYQDNLAEALRNYFVALQKSEEIGSKNGISLAHSYIGNSFDSQGNYPEALKHHFLALKISEEISDKHRVASGYNDIGLVYWRQGNYPDALKNYLASLEIMEEIGEESSIALIKGNIGLLYFYQGKYQEALKNQLEALKVREKLGDKLDIADSYNNIAIIYEKQGMYSDALKKNLEALKIREEMGNKEGIAGSYINLGSTNMWLENFAESKKQFDKGISIAKEIEKKEWLKDGYEGLARLDSMMGNYKASLEHYKMYLSFKDSLLNAENTKKSIQAAMNYQFEKKQSEEKLLQQKKDAIIQQEKQKQEGILFFVICGLLLVVVFALFLFNRWKVTQSQKTIIEIQKVKVDQAYYQLGEKSKIIEEKNKDISDSIKYSKRIQDASLAPRELRNRIFPNAFVLFKPKDIVSGDFYWFAEKNGKRLIACCDCTGHGVPGALMSMIGNNILNQIVNEKGITSPDEILNRLHKEVRQALKQEELGASKDGMDIALVSFNSETEIEYAGAHRPLWILRSQESGVGRVEKGEEDKNQLPSTTAQGYQVPVLLSPDFELTEIKPDKFSIGGHQSETERKFTKHKISLSKGDCIYIFSDGFVDQFGGNEGKKYMSKRFKNLLLANYAKPMSEQEIKLIATFENWKGSREQVDDILVIGIRI